MNVPGLLHPCSKPADEAEEKNGQTTRKRRAGWRRVKPGTSHVGPGADKMCRPEGAQTK
jgi:hypothetical protein